MTTIKRPEPIRLTSSHQAMINSLAAFTKAVLDHNDSDVADEEANLVTAAKHLGHELKQFMAVYDYKTTFSIRPLGTQTSRRV